MPVDFSGGCRLMDFNVHGNVYAGEQRDRSEESRWHTQLGSREAERIQRWKNERQKKQQQGIGPVRSNESARNGGERDFHRNQRYRRVPASRQGEDYAKMCEHRRGDSIYQGNCPDRNARDFTGQNIREHIGQLEPRYDNYGRDGIECDASTSNDPCGINVSVVPRQPPCESFHAEKRMCNVSFKHCCDNNNAKPDQKRRNFFSANDDKSRGSRWQEPSRCERTVVGKPSNFRCTFENCCGNCEPYVVQVRSNDCNSYEKWQNDGLETAKNGCLDDCCCPRDVKPRHSSVSVPQQPCVIYEETEAKYDSPADHRHDASTSKHCLQRVHFADAESRAKTDHSSCSFCSRKCTPSMASLFVEIGESVANVCNLASARCDESTEELLKGDASRKESRTARGYKFESSNDRSGGSKTGESTMCSSSCKGQPGAYSNNMDVRPDDYTVDQIPEEPYYPELQSSVRFQELGDSRAQTEGDTYVKRKTTGCSQQCETNDHSLLNDIRRQLHDTYKNFVRVATTSIGQIVKQSSKLKRSKKGTKDRSTCGTCTKDCEGTARPDQCDQSETHNECVHEAACWREIMNHESSNCDAHCCGNVCCDNVAGLPDCQTPMCQNDCWKGARNVAKEQIQSEREWHFDSYENPRNRTPLEELWYPTYDTARKKGGGDTYPQRKKQSSSSKCGGQSVTCGHRESPNSGSQIIKQQQRNPSTAQDQQTESSATAVHMCVQTGSVRATVNPANGTYVAENTAYRKTVKTVKRGEPNIRHSKEEPKKQTAPAKKKPPPSPKYAVTACPSRSTKREMSLGRERDSPKVKDERMKPVTGRAVQCRLLKEVVVKCASIRVTPSRVVDMCACVPRKDTTRPGEAEDAPEAVAESIEEEAEKDDEAPVTEDTVVEESVEEETSEKDTTEEEASAEEILVEKTPAEEEAPTEEAPVEEILVEETPAGEEAPTEEAPEILVEEILTEETLPEITEPPDDTAVDVSKVVEEAPPSTLTAIPDRTTDPDKEDSTARIELTKELHGKRTTVSVQMQTSNTILTQILSEFQVGNKKNQILMSIKVQSNLEECDAEQRPSNNPSTSNEVTSPSRPDVYDHRRRMRRPPDTACTHRRALTAPGVDDSSMTEFISRASYQRVQRTYLRRLYDTFYYTSDGIDRDLCGPCGKRKR